MLLFLTLSTFILLSDARTVIEDIFAYLSIVVLEHIAVVIGGTLILAIGCGLYSIWASKKTEYSLDAEAKCMEGADEEQVKLMKERVILLDEQDNIIGHESKKNSHLNSNIFGKNMLHRAFSVFIFNKNHELLMQKRSDDKITFPSFWANSCCSHPLHFEEEMETKNAMGVKRAARRKILQELGIPPEELPIESFHFLTRVHYKAKSDEVWGEHEIDHILFCMPPKDVVPRPNPNEVADVKYFSMEALNDFVRTAEDSNTLISPWFRVIHATLLPKWWMSLMNGTLKDEVDLKTIHRAGMASNSGSKKVGDHNKKQGAYGKVKIHKEGILAQLLHMNEIWALVELKYFSNWLKDPTVSTSPDESYCNAMLGKTSRSFTMVIRHLPEELKLCVCIFYIVLRALDTIEDDTRSFTRSEYGKKIELLKSFHEHLGDPNWTLTEIGECDERELLENFDKVSRTFSTLNPKYQDIIKDITRRMGEGMAEYVSKDMGQGTINVKEYNQYCYYVAGLVGEGLSSLFVASGKEVESVAINTHLSDSMGKFLQKVNIIRDFLEDYVDKRAFWPQEIWKKYANELGELAEETHRNQALKCLNEMVLDAMTHIPDCLTYLGQIQDSKVLSFCAIPQLMAIATLSKLYNNPQVFTGVVKIRKGLAAEMIISNNDIETIHNWFVYFIRVIEAKAIKYDSNAKAISSLAEQVTMMTASSVQVPFQRFGKALQLSLPFTFIGAIWYLLSFTKHRETGSVLPRLSDTTDVVVLALLFCSTALAFAFLGFPQASSMKKTKTL